MSSHPGQTVLGANVPARIVIHFPCVNKMKLTHYIDEFFFWIKYFVLFGTTPDILA